MLNVQFKGLRRVLCLGAHSDDIEIGCGGTILKLARDYPRLEVCWVVFSAEAPRHREARASALAFLGGLKHPQIIVKQFRGSFFPYEGKKIKECFERLKKQFTPDLILTQFRDDRHQDHRIMSDLAWNTFRNHLIWEYEIPKYDGDLGSPNVFVELDEGLCREKIRLLLRHFRTQSNKHWFEAETFMGLLRLRGMECASPTSYAEAFYCRKVVVS